MEPTDPPEEPLWREVADWRVATRGEHVSLVDAALSGNEEALAEFARVYCQAILHLAYSYDKRFGGSTGDQLSRTVDLYIFGRHFKVTEGQSDLFWLGWHWLFYGLYPNGSMAKTPPLRTWRADATAPPINYIRASLAWMFRRHLLPTARQDPCSQAVPLGPESIEHDRFVEDTPLDHLSYEEVKAHIDCALSSLKPRNRGIVNSVCFAGISPKVVAIEAGVTPAVATNVVYRFRKELGKSLFRDFGIKIAPRRRLHRSLAQEREIT